MKQYRHIPTLLVTALILAACGTNPPKSNAQLEEARSSFRMAQNNPDVATLAPLELKKAGDTLELADAAFARHDSELNINHLAYVSKQQSALSEEVAKQKNAELAVTEAEKQRGKMQLKQRTNEADNAKIDAAIAQNSAFAAQQGQADAEERASHLQAQLDELSAKKTERGIVLTFGDVLFNVNKSELSQNGMRNIQKLADILSQNPTRVVVIEGYTDSTGSAAHNLGLSERRAASVGRALNKMGVASKRYTTSGYGEAYPADSNDTEAGRQVNRRVEIILSGEDGKISPR